jgi:hypothetical protein
LLWWLLDCLVEASLFDEV